MIDKFNLAFFSSSDFVVPIIESVYNSCGQNLRQIFEKQIAWLNHNQKQFAHILPQDWLDIDLDIFGTENNDALWQIIHRPIELNLIVSQPDRVNHNKTVSNPVVTWARKNGVSLFTPNKINKELESLDLIRGGQKIDMAILASFGQILSEKVLSYPKFGFVNWHPSMLPKYRGPTPMQAALVNGDTTTGLSWLEMTKAMDAGDIWLQLEFELSSKTTFSELAGKMAEVGANTWALPIFAKLESLTRKVN